MTGRDTVLSDLHSLQHSVDSETTQGI